MYKIYLAGPIESAGGNMNEPLFDHVARQLRKRKDCEVFNPWDLTRELVGSRAVIEAMSKEERRKNRRGLLAKELTWIIHNANVVVLLPGWEQSPGATAEHATAVALGIAIHILPDSVSLMQDDEIHIETALPAVA